MFLEVEEVKRFILEKYVSSKLRFLELVKMVSDQLTVLYSSPSQWKGKDPEAAPGSLASTSKSLVAPHPA